MCNMKVIQVAESAKVEGGNLECKGSGLNCSCIPYNAHLPSSPYSPSSVLQLMTIVFPLVLLPLAARAGTMTMMKMRKRKGRKNQTTSAPALLT